MSGEFIFALVSFGVMLVGWALLPSKRRSKAQDNDANQAVPSAKPSE